MTQADTNKNVDHLSVASEESSASAGSCEEQLLQLKKLVAEKNHECDIASQELNSFCYSVSHDLRAPLRSLNGFSQALMDDYAEQLDDVARDYLHRIRNASQKMHTLIDNLLTLSRINQFEMGKEEINLSEIVEKIFENIQRQNRDEDAELRLEKELITCADKNLMSIVIENLLSNAWKFRAEAQTIRIEFGRVDDKEKNTFYLRDNGIGIEERHMKKIFTPFQRIHGEDEYPGAGIGLAMAQRIIHRHKGEIWLESVAGSGTTVFFSCGPA